MHGEIEFKGDGPFFVLPETRFEIHDICPRFVLRYGLVYSRHLLHQQTDVVDAHLSLLAQLVHGFINTKSACFPRGAKQLLVFVPLHHNNISTCQTLHTHTHTQTQIILLANKCVKRDNVSHMPTEPAGFLKYYSSPPPTSPNCCSIQLGPTTDLTGLCVSTDANIKCYIHSISMNDARYLMLSFSQLCYFRIYISLCVCPVP